MSVWIISDFHLSLKKPYVPGAAADLYKPMDVFSPDWASHVERLYASFAELVRQEDTVFIPGDISWAIGLADGVHDFAFLGQLPGRLVVSKGNHDFWWDTKSKAQSAMPPNVTLLQNESYQAEGLTVAAARGWYCPGSADFDDDAAKIYRRELIRLEMALQDAVKKSEAAGGEWERVVVMHFPPVNDKRDYNEMIALMQKYKVSRCYYGHLHGVKSDFALQGEHWGIEFGLISTDFLGHRPLRIR
jgi:hypothetical protein